MLAYDGLSDIGLEKEKQEDIIFRSDLGKGFSLFIIADGVGMVSESMNPAVIASVEIEQFLKRQVDYDADNFTEHIEHLMEESFLTKLTIRKYVYIRFMQVSSVRYSLLNGCVLFPYARQLQSLEKSSNGIYPIKRLY